ncbi:hypothetical protein, partial [Spiribacter roseus]|uniref:hypothetical protein n=1 Tax=Spiribacter roseus TaxID=1855875 RepID=UPI00132FE0F4
MQFPPGTKSVENGKLTVEFYAAGRAYRLRVSPVTDQPYTFLCEGERGGVVLKDQRKNIVYYEFGTDWQKSYRVREAGHINHVFFAKDRYICSLFSLEGKHFIVVLNTNLEEMYVNEVGCVGWHSQNAIDFNDDVIMYAEYPYNGSNSNDTKNPSVYITCDGGANWNKCFSIEYPEVRHWHTLEHVSNRRWVLTSGDTASQSRWFETWDDGGVWHEVTDYEYVYALNPKKSQSAHRTTTFEFVDEGVVCFGTDDIMGEHLGYFSLKDGIRESSSKFYLADLPKYDNSFLLKLVLQFDLGLHVRSLIEVDGGWLAITEAQYITTNWHVYFIEKSLTTRPYFVTNIPSERFSGGTNSVNSRCYEGIFYTKCALRGFLGIPCSALKWEFFPVRDVPIERCSGDGFSFSEYLWFVSDKKKFDKIMFHDGRLDLEFGTNLCAGETAELYQGLPAKDVIGEDAPIFRVPPGLDYIYFS